MKIIYKIGLANKPRGKRHEEFVVQRLIPMEEILGKYPEIPGNKRELTKLGKLGKKRGIDCGNR